MYYSKYCPRAGIDMKPALIVTVALAVPSWAGSSAAIGLPLPTHRQRQRFTTHYCRCRRRPAASGSLSRCRKQSCRARQLRRGRCSSERRWLGEAAAAAPCRWPSRRLALSCSKPAYGVSIQMWRASVVSAVLCWSAARPLRMNCSENAFAQQLLRLRRRRRQAEAADVSTVCVDGRSC
jgi:hypothetical protein